MNACMKGWDDVKANKNGRCCCNCEYHLVDYHHCTTIDRQAVAAQTGSLPFVGCVCLIPKGWICCPPDDENKMCYSGWSEHGMCEMHQFKKE